MSRDLPSLNAVRMFEAAARNLNFTRAAEQLHVTQGAVSRQIKHLEQDLEQALFHRDGPKLQLTDAGQKFFRATAEALAIIRRSTLDLKRLAEYPSLTISVLPSLAAKWLVPRIANFQHDNANVELRIATSYEPVDFSQRPDIDAAIRFGQGDWAGVFSQCLIREQVFPVCSPDFLRRAGGLKSPKDIGRHQLIYASESYDQWDDWFKAAGVSPPDYTRGPRYSDALLLHQAALEGQGITLTRSLVVDDELRSGRLIRLFETSVASANSHYFVCPPGHEERPHIALLLRWLANEALNSNSGFLAQTAQEI